MVQLCGVIYSRVVVMRCGRADPTVIDDPVFDAGYGSVLNAIGDVGTRGTRT